MAQRNVERLAQGGSRSLEFFELVNTLLMDVRQLETAFSLVEPGFATVEFARGHHE